MITTMREMISMGWWNLKDNLNPHECLQLRDSYDNDNFFTVIDFVEFETKSGELNETDLDHIYQQIKQGMVAGQVNDWDHDN